MISAHEKIEQVTKRNGPAPRLYKHRGVILTLKQWSEKLGIRLNTLYCRIHYGWHISDVLGQRQMTPGGPHNRGSMANKRKTREVFRAWSSSPSTKDMR